MASINFSELWRPISSLHSSQSKWWLTTHFQAMTNIVNWIHLTWSFLFKSQRKVPQIKNPVLKALQKKKKGSVLSTSTWQRGERQSIHDSFRNFHSWNPEIKSTLWEIFSSGNDLSLDHCHGLCTGSVFIHLRWEWIGTWIFLVPLSPDGVWIFRLICNLWRIWPLSAPFYAASANQEDQNLQTLAQKCRAKMLLSALRALLPPQKKNSPIFFFFEHLHGL